MATIEREIDHAYSGKAGKCCCGCAGKHYYPSDPAKREASGKARGYAIDDNEISDRMIKRIKAKLEAAPIAEIDGGPNYLSFETEGRLYILYLRD